MPTIFSPVVCNPVTVIAVVVPGDERLKLRIRLALVTAYESTPIGVIIDGIEGPPSSPPPPQLAIKTEPNK
jgi:hypothetical protein